jgi:two-component system KDP operon response regulator KdpE
VPTTGELLARVRVALRVNRYGGGSLPGGVFSAQGLTINYERRKVFVDGQEVRLTQTEYNIVAFLSEHAGRVMTYAAIVRAIWGDTDASSTKKLQVNMANIRKKLGSRPGSNTYILNELGVGYRMIEEDAKPMESAEETK